MKYNIVFSIPIHERLEVVIDQVFNYFHYNPHCAIVFHISEGFNYNSSFLCKEDFINIANQLGNVYINPQSVRTGLRDIIQAHLSNFHYISKIADFEYFCMSASNEMFIQKGLFDYIKQFDCGYNPEPVIKESKWRTGNEALKDRDLKAMLSELNTDSIVGSQIEGTFYKKHLFDSLVNLIEKYFDYNKIEIKYPRDEIYFSSIVEAKINFGQDIIVNKNNMVTYVPWGSYTMNVSIRKICNLQKGMKKTFCVKRVPRVLNDTTRQFLRMQGGYMTEESKYLPIILHSNIFVLRIKELNREIYLYIKGHTKSVTNKFKLFFS